MKLFNGVRAGRAAKLASVSLVASWVAGVAQAQSTTSSKPLSGGLEEVVVTAQKSDQMLQKVPVAETVLTPDALQANRVANVTDLNGLVPSMKIAQSPGSVGLPVIVMRGAQSFGVVPGSDKQVAFYIDGMYYGAPQGAIFDLADIGRMEVLRGPQGTLFGRNSVAGAISISTPNPNGEFGIHQELSSGNYGYFRTKTRIDSPEWNGLSAFLTYVKNQNNGYIKNLQGGKRWTTQTSISNEGSHFTSPGTLGDKDLDAYLVGIEYAPASDFTLTYKFDYEENNGTPQAYAFVADNGLALSYPYAGRPLALNARRPSAVAAGWSTRDHNINWGHNLTAEWEVNENLSLKNIIGYRREYSFSMQDASGLGVFSTPDGDQQVSGTINTAKSDFWSDEAQLTYVNDYLTLTTGAVYFWEHDFSGNPPGYSNVGLPYYGGGLTDPVTNTPGVIAATFLNGYQGQNYNQLKTWAGYIQAEGHITSKLDLVGGFRLTHDQKSGDSVTAVGSPATSRTFSFTYKKNQPTYLLGLNYQVTDDMLSYIKYTTGFVSGGAVADITFEPETVKSWEVGMKAEWFEHRLRTNLALYRADYNHLQDPNAGIAVGRPELGIIVVDGGKLIATGAEFEVDGKLTDHLGLGGSVGYSHTERKDIPPPESTFHLTPLTLRARWTVGLYADYASDPVFDNVFVHFRPGAQYQSATRANPYDLNYWGASADWNDANYIPGYWTVTARLGLEGFKVYGGKASIALWGKNLTNVKVPSYVNGQPGLFAAASFVDPRTYGVDLTLDF